MYRIAIEDELKKKDIRKGRQQLAFAVEASKQQVKILRKLVRDHAQ